MHKKDQSPVISRFRKTKPDDIVRLYETLLQNIADERAIDVQANYEVWKYY